MALDDAKTIAKLAKAAKTADKVNDAAKAADVIVNFKGVKYRFPPGTDPVAAKMQIWTKVVGPTVRGNVEDVVITEPKPDLWSLKEGSMGWIPKTSETDRGYYNVFERAMTPDQFLGHTPAWPGLATDENAIRIKRGLQEGKKMVPPTLWVKWDPIDKNWVVISHEGRHRSAIVKDWYDKDIEMPVQLIPHDWDGNPIKGAGKLTDEQLKAPVIGVGAAAVVPAAMEKNGKKMDLGWECQD